MLSFKYNGNGHHGYHNKNRAVKGLIISCSYGGNWHTQCITDNGQHKGSGISEKKNCIYC